MKHLIRLPALNGTKTISPLGQLWRLVDGRFPCTKGKDYVKRNQAVKLHPDTDMILHDKEKLWMKRKNKHLTEHGFDYSFAMHWLQCSPSENDRVPIGKAEVDIKTLWVRRKL